MIPLLIGGKWQEPAGDNGFRAENPQTGEEIGETYPVSVWSECDAALSAAEEAAGALAAAPVAAIGRFLDAYAEQIEARADALVEMAHAETALPSAPRLADVELPRTTNQLRQAAAAAREQTWRGATIDTAAGIRSCRIGVGPVWVIGPNNFPFAFNGCAGGDFAAAIAAGNPVIAKAHGCHPGTSRIFAEAAYEAAAEAELPSATVQLLYRMDHEVGFRMASDSRLGAIAYTGGRTAGLRLKEAADAAGTPIYLELSSINPVVMLPRALDERGDEIASEYAASCLMGVGQFCTNPGLVLLIRCDASDAFVQRVREAFETSAAGTLLSRGVARSLADEVSALTAAGAECLVGGKKVNDRACAFENTLLRIDGDRFLSDRVTFQGEMFGNASLVVVSKDVAQVREILKSLDGNLTGTIYSAVSGADDAMCAEIEPVMRRRVGRLLNDKMPTGVAVSAAMNHGGPYPATGHPGFTAVGIPASIPRFSMLASYDNVRENRLPDVLRDKNVSRETWRWIDGRYTTDDVEPAKG